MLQRKWIALEIGLVVAVFLLLAVWYVTSALPQGKALQGALAKVPLPPGTEQFEIEGDDLDSSFYITTEYTDRTKEEIETFYLDWFADDGWTNNLGEEESEGYVVKIMSSYDAEAETVEDLNMGVSALYGAPDATKNGPNRASDAC